MKKRVIVLLIFAFLTISLVGCAMEDSAEILATTAPIQQFAQAVCEGTTHEIGVVISEPVSCIHDYTLTTRQMKAIEQAERILCTDPSLEPFMEDALSTFNGEVFACADGIPLLPGEEAGEYDPHIWLSPENDKMMVQNLAAYFSVLYPEEAQIFQNNADSYCARLDALQLECETLLQNLSCRDIVTFHDGFAYFAQSFDLNILAAIEEESGSEASAADIKEIVSLVRDYALPAVFVEKDGSRSAASAISSETGCQIGILGMGFDGTDIIETIRGNAEAISEVMQ